MCYQVLNLQTLARPALILIRTCAGVSDVVEGLAGIRLNEGQAIVPKLSAKRVISQVFPLHDMPALGRLQTTWVRAVLETQPLGML